MMSTHRTPPGTSTRSMNRGRQKSESSKNIVIDSVKSISDKNINNDCDISINELKKIVLETNKNIKLILDENAVIKIELNEIKKNCDLMYNELKKLKGDSVCTTYADQLKGHGPIVLIAPKDASQKSETTKEIVKKNLNPVQNKVNGIRNVSKGAVIIECKDKNSSEQLRSEALETLGENYQVVLPKKRKPKMKICDMSENLTEDELLDYLIKQNECFKSKDEVKVLKINENKQKKFQRFEAIVETNVVNYENVLKCNKLSVNWDKCKVFPYIKVTRCFKCSGFNHHQKDCNKTVACGLCAGQHETKDCKSDIKCCVNCVWCVKNLKMNLDTNHDSFSKNCKVLKRKYEQEERRIDLMQ